MSRRSGHVARRGDRKWQVRIYVGTHPDTGKRIYRAKTVHGTKKDADEYLREQLRQRDRGLLVEPARMPLGEYLDRWLRDDVAPRVRPRTLQDYRRFLDKYVRPALGSRPLNKLTPLDIQGLYTKIGEQSSAHAVVHTHRPLRAALEQAVRWRYLPENPAKGVRVPQESRAAIPALTAAEAARFREAAGAIERGFVFTFTLATGMRPGEVQALQWKDCDLEAGIVRVERSMVWLQDDPDPNTGKRRLTWRFGEPKTKRSRRAIPLPSSIAQELRAHRAAQSGWKLKLGAAYVDYDLIFASDTGGPLDGPNLAHRTLKPILKAASLPTRFRWYDCRHTCATLLLAAGENPKVVSERLGHSTVAFTLDRYGHVLPGMQSRASETLDRILNSRLC